MSERVVAISSHIDEIGKRVSDSKKKFTWKFRIGTKNHKICLVSSALSGKRVVTLNDEEIYSQKNVLNTNFDFIHNLDGHSIRIFKEPEGVNVYGCRIDNRVFDYLLKKAATATTTVERKESKYAAKNDDPFSEFANFASKKTQVTSNNQFGDFDTFDDNFSAPVKKSESPKKVESKKESIDFFDFGESKKDSKIEQNFETNNFENLAQNMNNIDLLGESNEFTTNTYAQYSNYLDLIGNTNEPQSDIWGTEEANREKTMKDKIKPDISGKQMLNKTRMTAVELKKKAVDLLDL